MALFVAAVCFLWTADRVAAQTPPYYEPADCMYEPIIPGTDYSPVECGYVVVPEQRFTATGEPAPAAAEGDTIRLAVVILRSLNEQPAADPLVVAQGGPGGSTIDTYVDLLGNHPIRDNRDIVLFDQRGTLYSEPNLLCTESYDALPDLLTADEETYLELAEGLAAACRARLEADGINLSAYNSLENAADVEDVRAALGYDTINFYGVSYGTLLGLHLMRDYPDHLRSVILDGVVPTQDNFITQAPASADRVYTLLFDSCAESAECSMLYPDLEERYFALIERLNENPATVTITDPETGNRYRVALAGDDVADFVFQLFYVSGSAGILPKVIDDIDRGDYAYLGAMLSAFVFDRTMSEGMYNSVICAEETDFSVDPTVEESIRPALAESLDEEMQEYVDICTTWNVPQLDPRVNEPVSSELPTLLLSGEYDPITPPAFAATAAETLPNSVNLVLPGAGHGVAFAVDECMDEIVMDFLADPQSRPDTSCLATRPAVEYAAADSVTVPLLAHLNSMSATAVKHMAISASLLLVMLSALVVWPVGWLVRTLQAGSRQARPVEPQPVYTPPADAAHVGPPMETPFSELPPAEPTQSGSQFETPLPSLAALETAAPNPITASATTVSADPSAPRVAPATAPGPAGQHRSAAGRWLVVAFDLVALIFVIGLVTVVATTAFNNPNLLLLSAVPAGAKWLTWLPLILLALTVLIVVAALNLWRRNDVLWRTRIYYTVLAACAVGYIWILMLDGFFIQFLG